MSVKNLVFAALSSLLLFTGTLFASTLSPEGAEVYIISPADGDTVTSPVTVRFGLKGMGIAPAGVAKANTGHHHLLIDMPEGPALDKTLPAEANHVHFGGCQTEATIELSTGKHTLQLIMGDMNHIPHNQPVISEMVTVTVK